MGNKTTTTTAAKFSRSDLLKGVCTHRQFYAQFVNEATKRAVLRRIPLRKLKETEGDLSKIPCRDAWDSLGSHAPIAIPFSEVGDTRSLSGGVCIVKEAARQILEANH